MIHHDLFEYEPLSLRPALSLPNGAKVAVWVIPNVEYFAFDLPAVSNNPGCAHYVPDVLNYSWRDYGTRVGIWRTVDLLDEFNIRATVALNGMVCDYYPLFVEEAVKRKWEFMGHGMTNSKVLAGMDEKEEKEVIAQSVKKLTESTGQKPRGWLSPGLSENFGTLDLLAEEGFEYVCDWINDVQPYYITTKKQQSLIFIPYDLNLNDISVFIRGGYSPEQYHRMLVDQFEVLYKEGAKSARIMAISLHPFITGVPFRHKYLRKAIKEIASCKDVWFATGSEIVDWYTSVSPKKITV